jgi:two-component system nitrate/nitrite response regulator NarL
MIRIAAIDDHPLFLDGLLRTLAAAPDFEIVGSGTTSADAVRIAANRAPDVVVLDMSLPAATDGIAAVEGIAAAAPGVRVLMLTVVADDDRVIEAMRKGAHGYVLKGISGNELIEVVRLVHGGQSYIAPTLAARLVARLGRPPGATERTNGTSPRLGAREDQILALIAKGFSNKEIGLQLDLSDKTVKLYVTGLLQKLHVRNRTQAAAIAAQWAKRQHPDLQPG